MPNSFKRINSPGFTLIEILVAVSIIAIISAVGLAAYSKAQSVARDTKRRQDLVNIRTVLELYKQKNGTYPTTSSWVDSSAGGTWIPGLDASYMNSLPTDPQQSTNSCSPGTCYTYGYWGDTYCGIAAGTSFILAARLENSNTNDPHSTQFNGNPDPSCKWDGGTNAYALTNN